MLTRYGYIYMCRAPKARGRTLESKVLILGLFHYWGMWWHPVPNLLILGRLVILGYYSSITLISPTYYLSL